MERMIADQTFAAPRSPDEELTSARRLDRVWVAQLFAREDAVPAER